MFSCALVSFIKMDGAQRPGNTSSLLLFAQLSPSIYLCPSICLLLALCLFCFCPCASIICKIYVSLSILSFDQSGVGIGKICNSLSILFLSYLSANVFHLGFSISMSMRSIRLSKPIERSLLAIEMARSVCRSKLS